MKQSKAQDKIVNLLSDGQFHSNKELCNIAGWRFGGTLFTMRKKGFIFEKKAREYWEDQYIEYWKLLSSPETPNKIQVKAPENTPEARRTWIQILFNLK